MANKILAADQAAHRIALENGAIPGEYTRRLKRRQDRLQEPQVHKPDLSYISFVRWFYGGDSDALDPKILWKIHSTPLDAVSRQVHPQASAR